MNLVNKKVSHKTFGEGRVIDYDDSYIKINFEEGEKKFLFPDAFKDYITFIDESANDLVNKKNEVKDAEIREEERLIQEEKERQELILKEEKALEEERKYIIEQKKRLKSNIVHSKIQSVFWCEEGEEEEIFKDWQVFTGEIKSGKNKGKPRKLPRMNQNSVCLITRRQGKMKEEERQILGLFMADESFDGRKCEDGYIKAHPKYRIQLTEEESEKMLFWNYYIDEKSPESTTWNSGRQRYYDNIWTAQILRDIIELKEDPKEIEEAKAFFEEFCRVNIINPEKLPVADGVLMNI